MKETYIVCGGFETCFEDDLTGSSIVRLSVFGCFVEVFLKTCGRLYTCCLMMFKGFVKMFLERVWTVFEGRKTDLGKSLACSSCFIAG